MGDDKTNYGYTYTHEQFDVIIEGIFDEIRKLDSKAVCGYFLETDDCDTITDLYHPVGSLLYTPSRGGIGVKSLREHQQDGYVRNDDFVITIKSAYHELCHEYLRTRLYMREGVKDYVKNAAEVSICADYLPEYKSYGYYNLPEEIICERFGILHASKKFENMSLPFDWKKILVDDANNRRFLTLPVRTFDDLVSAYSSRVHSSYYSKRLGFYVLNDEKEASSELNELDEKGLLIDILNSANGKDEVDILVKYISANEPAYFRGFQCIKPDYEVKNLRNRYENLLGRSILQIGSVPIDGENDFDFEV